MYISRNTLYSFEGSLYRKHRGATVRGDTHARPRVRASEKNTGKHKDQTVHTFEILDLINPNTLRVGAAHSPYIEKPWKGMTPVREERKERGLM